jgi:hypothetical protein
MLKILFEPKMLLVKSDGSVEVGNVDGNVVNTFEHR